jgi:hypothetical protein
MEWKDVSEAIGKYAPAATTLLGAASLIPGAGIVTGPAAMVVGALAKAFGTDPTPDAIHAAISADPQAATKIYQAEIDFKLASREQDIKELQEILGDKQSARGRDVAIRQGGRLNVRADIMLTGAFVCVVVICIVLATGSVDPSTAIGTFLIMAGTAFLKDIGTAFDFEFGASRIQVEQAATMAASSARKTELLSQADAIRPQ